MKKIIFPLTISIIGGVIALFIHNLNFNHNEIIQESLPENKMVNISYDSSSSRSYVMFYKFLKRNIL